MSRKRVSIVDVAKTAGVSYQTVSRVINNSPSVRPSTRKKVQETIDQLNYRPSLSAQSLKTQRTRVIGIVASQTQYSGPLLTISAIETIARSQNLFVSVATVDEEHLTSSDFGGIEESFIQLGVDAVVIVAPTEAMVTFALESDVHVPRVIITAAEGIKNVSSRKFDIHHVKFVSTNQQRVSNEIGQLLRKAEIKKVYYLNGPQQWRDAFARRIAAENTCKNLEIEFESIDMDTWLSAKSYEKVTTFLHCHNQQSIKGSVFWAANDLLAMGARRALMELNFSVPQEVGLIGYDNMPGTESLIPPLTTVNPNYEGLGSVAMQLVLQMLDYMDNESVNQCDLIPYGDLPQTFAVEPELILRNTLLSY